MADFNSGENPGQYADHLRQEIHERVRRKMERRWRHRSGRGGLFGGLLLIGFGVLFLLQNLGFVYFDRVWDFWPVILIVVGLGRLARGWGFGGRLWSLALIAIGVVFLLRNFHFIHGDVWRFLWPLILIFIGLGMLAGNMKYRQHWAHWAAQGTGGPFPRAGGPGAGTTEARPQTPGPGSPKGDSGSPAAGSSVNVLNETAIFGGIRRRIESQEFEGGSAMAFCGGIELDLTKAASTKPEIVIEATAIFGGIDMRVPENWTVVAQGSAILGGYDDQTIGTHRDVPSQTRLVMHGSAIFGGVTIKN